MEGRAFRSRATLTENNMSEKATQFLRELAALTKKHNVSIECADDEIWLYLDGYGESHYIGNIYPGEIPAVEITTETI